MKRFSHVRNSSFFWPRGRHQQIRYSSRAGDAFEHQRRSAASFGSANIHATSPIPGVLPNMQLSRVEKQGKTTPAQTPTGATSEKASWLAAWLLKSWFIRRYKPIQSLAWTIGYYYSMARIDFRESDSSKTLLEYLQPPFSRNLGSGPPAQWYLDWFGSSEDRAKAVDACKFEHQKVFAEYMKSRDLDCERAKEALAAQGVQTSHILSFPFAAPKSPESIMLYKNLLSHEYIDEDQERNLAYGYVFSFDDVKAIINSMNDILKSEEVTLLNLVALRRLVDRMLGCPKSLSEALTQYRKLLARTSPDHNHVFLSEKGDFEKTIVYGYFEHVKALKALLEHPVFKDKIFEVPSGELGLKSYHNSIEAPREIRKVELPLMLLLGTTPIMFISPVFFGFPIWFTVPIVVFYGVIGEAKMTPQEEKYARLFDRRPPHNFLLKMTKNYFHMLEFIGSKLPI